MLRHGSADRFGISAATTTFVPYANDCARCSNPETPVRVRENASPWVRGSFRDFRSDYDVCAVCKRLCSLLKSRNTGKAPG